MADIASIALQTPGLVSRSDWPRPADEDRRSQKKINKKTIGIGSKSKHQAQGSTKVESQPQAKKEERDVSIGLHEPDDGKKVTQCECRISNGHEYLPGCAHENNGCIVQEGDEKKVEQHQMLSLNMSLQKLIQSTAANPQQATLLTAILSHVDIQQFAKTQMKATE